MYSRSARWAVGVTQKKVDVHDLEVGMFVSELDRPWHETPFPIQGFYIRNEQEIRTLCAYCRWVKVDIAESRSQADDGCATESPFWRKRKDQAVLQLPPLQIKNAVEYPILTTLKRELKASSKLLGEAEVALKKVAEQVRQGVTPQVEALTPVVAAMTSSVLRNPDALLWLIRVRDHDSHSYRQSMAAAVWALLCGRHLGLEDGLLKQLGLGAMLAHIGKAELPQDLLRREHRLEPDELALFRGYVNRGVEKLRASGASKAVISIVQYHRERHNGSGFPQGVKGDRIPVLAKIVGLVDYYQSLIEPREGDVPLTPAQAVAHLYELRNIEFQSDLVERFIQSIGVYPTGTLVELSDGRRGVVVSHSPARRLWPRVMVMTDRQHQPLKSGRVINLAAYNAERAQDDLLSIRGCLPFGTKGLDTDRLDVASAESSKWSLRRLVGG